MNEDLRVMGMIFRFPAPQGIRTCRYCDNEVSLEQTLCDECWKDENGILFKS